MHAQFSVLRLFAILAVLLPAFLAAAAEPEDSDQVGLVNKVENQAQLISVAGATTALVGTAVHMKDELRTGAGARLQVIFRDDTVLTLGEHASVRIDRYVYDPDQGVGETVLQATKGAFRFATGKIKELKDKKIAVSTPVADIGVRGTEFWGGPINAKYGVLAARRRGDRLEPGGKRDIGRLRTGNRHPLTARCAGRAFGLAGREGRARHRERRSALASNRKGVGS